MRVLCAADIHIGRTSTRLPSTSNPSEFTCSSAWNRIVECALFQKVDCLVLAGDIVDRDNSRFEALDSLEKGLQTLSEANIRVYAVSGNHDPVTLQQIADGLDIPNFKMLGLAGNWECTEDPSGLRVLGRSYSKSDELSNPMDSFPESPHDAGSTLAIFHSSLSSTAGTYAPTSIAELAAHSKVTWVVGHIHQGSASIWMPSRNVIVPGSPQALNPRESGTHGVCIVSFEGTGIPDLEFIPISSLQYERLNIPLDGVQSEMEIPERIRSCVQPVRENAFSSNPHLKLLSLRVTFTGCTPLYNCIRSIVADLAREGSLDLGPEIQLEKFKLETGPCIDLDSLAKAEDVSARLASLIKSIDSAEVTIESQALLQTCLDYAAKTHARPAFSPIAFQKTGEQEDQIPDIEQVTEIVRTQAMTLLSELISQRECD